jgi:hypothetical protein
MVEREVPKSTSAVTANPPGASDEVQKAAGMPVGRRWVDGYSERYGTSSTSPS